jgi:hypothetical protein
MHRVVNKTPENLLCDHINGNVLDNRKENLRSCTNQENTFNAKIKNKSGYKGVCWHKRISKWNANIRINDKLIHLGYFEDIYEAAATYNSAAKEYFGEFARLNDVPIEYENIKHTKKEMKIGKSGYIGVQQNNSSKNWAADITIDRKRKRIGTFNSAIEAAKAYDRFVKENKLDNRTNGFEEIDVA